MVKTSAEEVSPTRSTVTRPTIIDIARIAGVSPTTVSNALNDRRHVDAETRAAVKAVAASLGYRPNLRARRLRTGHPDTIAIFSSMPFAIAAGPSRLGFLMEIAAAAAAAALETGIALVLVPPLEKGRPPLQDLQIDGAIVVEPDAEDPDVAALLERGIPVVSIGRQLGAETLPFIDIQSRLTTELLLGHLEERGARKIALMIGTARRNSYGEAEEAYRAFAAARGMEPLILRIEEAGGENVAHDAARELLRGHPAIDAICAPVDVFAAGAIKAAADLGLRIPDDLKLVTRYDGVRARECTPPLTAVDLHLDALAIAAVALLLEHVNGGTGRLSATGPRPALVLRGSSLAP